MSMDTLDDLLNDINAITSELGIAQKSPSSPAKSNEDRTSAESGFRNDSKFTKSSFKHYYELDLTLKIYKLI